ncbi:MAG: hypothetical protein AAGN82_30310, partial [Myxococcota bacterium]
MSRIVYPSSLHRTLWLLLTTVALLVAPSVRADERPQLLFLVAEEERPREEATRRVLEALFLDEEADTVAFVSQPQPARPDTQVLIARGLIVERAVQGVFWMTGPDEAQRETLHFVGANNEQPITRDITSASPETAGTSAALIVRWTADAIRQGDEIDHLEPADKAKLEPVKTKKKRKRKKKKRKKKKKRNS